MRAGSNLPAVGEYNRSVILDAVRRASDGVSRAELAISTGLSAQAVTNIVRRLIDAGLAVEDGTRANGIGKPRTILRLVPRARFAVGVHLDPAVISLVLLDLAGTVAARRQLSTTPTATAEKTIARIARAVPAMLAKAGIDSDLVIGVGVAAPGPIDVAAGIVLDPPLLPGWRAVPIRAELSKRLGMPVLLEKDVTAAVVAELWLDATGASDDMVFLYAGTGVGAGMVVEGEVIRGISGNAGDVGWLDSMRFDGVRHPDAWPLGDALNGPFLVREAISAGLLSGDDSAMTTNQLRVALTSLMAMRNVPRAERIFTRMIDGVADAVVRLVNLLDVDRVVFGGPYSAPLVPVLLDALPGRVHGSPHTMVPHSIEFVDSAAGEAVAARGAACLVLDDAWSPRTQELLIRRSIVHSR